jgi:hypothetical protein
MGNAYTDLVQNQKGRGQATSQNSIYVEYLLKLAFKKTYTAVKWIKLAEDYIHLKEFVL